MLIRNSDCAKSSEHEPLHRLTAVGNRPRRLGAVANGPPPLKGRQMLILSHFLSLPFRVRVSGGDLCEAEAPTEPAGETVSQGTQYLVTEGFQSATLGTLCIAHFELRIEFRIPHPEFRIELRIPHSEFRIELRTHKCS